MNGDRAVVRDNTSRCPRSLGIRAQGLAHKKSEIIHNHLPRCFRARDRNLAKIFCAVSLKAWLRRRTEPCTSSIAPREGRPELPCQALRFRENLIRG